MKTHDDLIFVFLLAVIAVLNLHCSGNVSLGEGDSGDLDGDIEEDADSDDQSDTAGDCTDGPCCLDGVFRSETFVCETTEEYQCSDFACGGQAQQRVTEHYCSGTSSECDGEIVVGDWRTTDNCSENQACEATEESAQCVECSYGCTETGCRSTPILDMATGESHTCLLSIDGSVRCWGLNTDGQLGYGHTISYGDNETAESAGIVDVGGEVVQIEAGRRHTCALLETGSVRCWGGRRHLGYDHHDTIGDDEAPWTAGDVGIDGEVIEISSSYNHTCALLESGELQCWGSNSLGEIGIGHTELALTPTTVDVGAEIAQISCGAMFTCVLLDTGAVRCWGRNDAGQLGYGHTDPILDASESEDVDVGGTVQQIATGYNHTCVLLDTGSVRCWGASAVGWLGYPGADHIGDNEHPSTAGDVDVGGTVTKIVTGGGHTCALLDTGAVRCWGSGSYLGYGNTSDIGDDEHPSSAGDIDMGGPVVDLFAGTLHSCAVLESGGIRCWGHNSYGQLGYGDNPVRIGDDEPAGSLGNINVGELVSHVSAGMFHSCVLLENGSVRCWGDNGYGQLGYGNTETIGDDEHPYVAGDIDVGGTVTQIEAGQLFSCALLDTGNVRCWGRSLEGSLGYPGGGHIGDDEHPSEAGDINIGGRVTQISTGEHHSCALLETGSVRCWGKAGSVTYNGEFHEGNLGYGNTAAIGDNEHPSEAGDVNIGDTVIQVAAGHNHTCAVLEGGSVRCWGMGLLGQLGYGNTDDIGDDELPYEAGDVEVGGTVTQITTGLFHTCALLESGSVRCWGNANYLGYGSDENIGDDETPASAGDLALDGRVIQISAGNQHTCAVLEDGGVRCWGQEQWGYSTAGIIGIPDDTGEIDLGGSAVQVSSWQHSCAVLESGGVRCWGYAGGGYEGQSYGRLGYPFNFVVGDDETPAEAGDVPL